MRSEERKGGGNYGSAFVSISSSVMMEARRAMQDVYTTAEDLALPPHAPRPHDNYVELQLEIIHWSRTWETYDKKKSQKAGCQP